MGYHVVGHSQWLNMFLSKMFRLACNNCIVCQTWTNAVRILVKMAAHASTASTNTRAGVKLATPGRAVRQVRHLLDTSKIYFVFLVYLFLMFTNQNYVQMRSFIYRSDDDDDDDNDDDDDDDDDDDLCVDQYSE